MTLEHAQLAAVKADIAGIRAFAQTKIEAGLAPLQEENQRLATELIKIQSRLQALQRAQTAPSNLPHTVHSGPYAGMTRPDLHMIAAFQAAMLEDQATIRGSDRLRVEAWGDRLRAAMDSTTAGSGDELVPTGAASELWMDVHLATKIYGLIPNVRMPTNPFNLPVDLGDMNMYPGVQNVATTSTDLTTEDQALTAYELVGAVPWSWELDEDAVISMQENVRATIIRSVAKVLDDVILNADTSVTNGINSDGATIAKTDAGKGHWLLGFDGLRHLPIITVASCFNDHAAAPSDDMFNENRRAMGKYGVDPNDVVHIMDIATYLHSQMLANVRTLDKFGPKATIFNGQLASHEGIPIIVSEVMRKTAADGKVTDGAAGTLGQLLTFNRTQWRTGTRREVTIDVERNLSKRQHIMYASVRLALQQQHPTATSARHTALQYNITV